MPGTYLPELFNQRPALFKLSQGSAVNPNDGLIPGYRFFQSFEDFPASVHPFFCLGIEQGGDAKTKVEQEEKNIVEKDTQTAVFQLGNKSNRKLLNYSDFTIFAPLLAVREKES